MPSVARGFAVFSRRGTPRGGIRRDFDTPPASSTAQDTRLWRFFCNFTSKILLSAVFLRKPPSFLFCARHCHPMPDTVIGFLPEFRLLYQILLTKAREARLYVKHAAARSFTSDKLHWAKVCHIIKIGKRFADTEMTYRKQTHGVILYANPNTKSNIKPCGYQAHLF